MAIGSIQLNTLLKFYIYMHSLNHNDTIDYENIYNIHSIQQLLMYISIACMTVIWPIFLCSFSFIRYLKYLRELFGTRLLFKIC